LAKREAGVRIRAHSLRSRKSQESQRPNTGLVTVINCIAILSLQYTLRQQLARCSGYLSIHRPTQDSKITHALGFCTHARAHDPRNVCFPFPPPLHGILPRLPHWAMAVAALKVFGSACWRTARSMDSHFVQETWVSDKRISATY
jgi:hypothetical protein